jgi:hypothetical protein
MRVIILLLVYGFYLLPCLSQDDKTINIEEISQRKVRKYIVSRSIDRMPDFYQIHASWNRGSEESHFHVNEKTFILGYSFSDVWECYRHTSPVKMWNCVSSGFGLLVSKSLNSAFYANDPSFPDIDTGQVYFLNLRLMKGLFNVPVAFEIIVLDAKRQVMEFSYIDNNKTLGKQTISFFDNGAGTTRIVHRSYFKSGSALRDGLFYPHFHKKFIKDFHNHMCDLLKKLPPAEFAIY